MASFGLDYENASRVNPSLVYCSLTGYGQKGPLSERAGHDINYLALSGLMGYSGRVAEGPALTACKSPILREAVCTPWWVSSPP